LLSRLRLYQHSPRRASTDIRGDPVRAPDRVERPASVDRRSACFGGCGAAVLQARAMYAVDVMLPRSAFTPRETARAGDVWRLFQGVAVGGSIQAGWPPERYREEGVSFVVRSMVVVHHREAIYGERLVGTTWPSRFRRG